MKTTINKKQTKAYLIFMDESGDTGFKFTKGSSGFFVLCLVIFDKPKKAEKASSRIKLLRKELKLPDKFEFKFSTTTTTKIKETFLKTVKNENFFYRAVVVNKKKLASLHSHQKQELLYLITAETLLLRGQPLNKSTLILDRINRQFLKKMNFFLNRRLNTRLSKIIKKIKADNSANNNLLQLTDMVCGAIYRKYSRRDEKFYHLIKTKEEEIYVPY